MWLNTTDEKSSEISALLKNVLSQVNELELPVAGLKKVVKTLHSLRVSTRIEAAKGYASGSAVLAKALDELGILVQEKVFEISELTEALIPVINRSISMEEIAQSGSIRVASGEVNKARRVLADFLDTFLETGHWTGRLKGSSDGVTRSFSEIVAALQFQDITRQRLEHVEKALNNLGRHLQKFSERQDFSNDAEAERLFGCICRLQHDQLELASREFVDAAENMTKNLNEMSNNVVAMASDTRSLLRVSDDANGNRYTVVLSALQSIAVHLEKTGSTHQSTALNLAEVNEGIQKVSLLVEEIEFVSEEMQLLALNAAISAAHARRQGAGLDVIAQNIQDVAEEACHYALSLAQQCSTITEHARSLQAVEQDNQSGGGDVRDLIEQAQKSMANLESSYADLVDMAEKVDLDARDLSREVAMIISTLNIGQLFREKLSPILKRFNELSYATDKRLSAAENASLEVLFNELELCYTMASERQIHHGFVGSQEQFVEALAKKEDEWASSRHHDLGDNVDLF
jgi:methyl-accepting chemotaxis protein